MVDVNQFKAKLKGGGARPNLFRVILTFPIGLAAPNTIEKLSFLCKATDIPGENLGVIEIPYLGRPFKIPGDRTFDDWSISVINDTDFELRDAFERWHQAMLAHEANTGVTDPQQIMVDAVIQQLDRRHNVVKSYEMIDAWPSSVEPIALDMGSNDQVEEFGVTFQYQYWRARTTL